VNCLWDFELRTNGPLESEKRDSHSGPCKYRYKSNKTPGDVYDAFETS
jgi:hypothetical protein